MFKKLGTFFSIQRILQIAAFAGAVAAIGGGWLWYQNYIWKPSIVIKSVDYNNGVAEVIINGKNIVLLGDATISARGSWAVRFGSNYTNGAYRYDRIELTRNGNVIDYLDQKPYF